ncbi:MAG: hydrogenase maturation protease [Gemmatimonadota bacterium]|jgi:hydrogenase maturation protease
MTRVAVVGLGNVLVGDDAFGPYVVRQFDARYDAGPDVEVADLGTPGLDLAPHIEGRTALIVVDTVSADGAPGVVKRYRKDDLLARPAPPRTNPHQPGVKETLLRLEVDDAAPADVLLVGVVPEATETGVGLSDAVRGATEEALAAIVAELERLGHPVAPRDPPARPDIWWERGRAGAS